MSELINKSNISNNKMFVAVNDLIRKIGVDKYESIKPLLASILTSHQIEQLNNENFDVDKKIMHKLNENPFNNEYINRKMSVDPTDLIEGIKSRGEEFINNFLADNLDIHIDLRGIYEEEVYGYCIPERSNKKKEEETRRHMKLQVEEAEKFLTELEGTVELSETYKEQIKTGISFLTETVDRALSNELQSDFDIEAVKMNVMLLRKSEMFCQPIFNKLEMKNGIFHAGWENLIDDYLRHNKSNEFKKEFSADLLFESFDFDYMKAYRENNEEILENKAIEFKNKYEEFNNTIKEATQKNLEVKKKTNSKKLR